MHVSPLTTSDVGAAHGWLPLGTRCNQAIEATCPGPGPEGMTFSWWVGYGNSRTLL